MTKCEGEFNTKTAIMINKTNTFPLQIQFARELRKNQTPEEEKIWDKVRGRRLLGYKFLLQHPIIVNKYNGRISFYIADFYCPEKKLVVEIDGLIHTIDIDYDKARDVIMNEMGLLVVRILNEEVHSDVYAVLDKIKTIIKQ